MNLANPHGRAVGEAVAALPSVCEILKFAVHLADSHKAAQDMWVGSVPQLLLSWLAVGGLWYQRSVPCSKSPNMPGPTTELSLLL